MPIRKAEAEAALRSTSRAEERVAILGALLARATKLGARLIVTGGSAISVVTRGDYLSGDVDIIGPRTRIAPVLESWGFGREEDSDGRPYWSRDDLGIAVDIINRRDYTGLRSGVRTVKTPYGPLSIAATEDLILRRLVFWKRAGRPELMDQAVAIFVLDRELLDTEYLEVLTRKEGVEDAYAELKRLANRVL